MYIYTYIIYLYIHIYIFIFIYIYTYMESLGQFSMIQVPTIWSFGSCWQVLNYLHQLVRFSLIEEWLANPDGGNGQGEDGHRSPTWIFFISKDGEHCFQEISNRTH